MLKMNRKTCGKKQKKHFTKILLLMCFFEIFFIKKIIMAQETPKEKQYSQKVGKHFLIDFPYSPQILDEKENNQPKITLQAVSEEGNMRFLALYKKIDIFTNNPENFYQQQIKKFVLPIGGMMYDKHTIDIAHHKAIKFRIKFRPKTTEKTHKEQAYVMFLVGDDYYLFSYLYEGFEKKPSREMETHFFQSLKPIE